MMTVAINAQISPRHPGGVETMLLSLLKSLGDSPRDDERYLLCAVRKHAGELDGWVGAGQTVFPWPFKQVGFPYAMAPGSAWARLREAAGGHRELVERIFRAWCDTLRRGPRDPDARQVDPVLRRERVDVVHFPYPLVFGTRLPFVCEPWDLQHRHYPDFFPPDLLRWRDRLYRSACEAARFVVTATHWVKRDLVAQYGLPPDKVVVIPRRPLAAAAPLPDEERTRVWQERGIPERYAFYPAMTFPHKNHLRLLQALARLRDAGTVVPLVCSGRIYEPHFPAVRAEVERLGLGDQVVFLGVVPDALLASLYERAGVVVFPSLFEGLGAPLLEAMQHGAPVVAADATCIPEVVDGAARLFDGHDVGDIAGAIAEALAGGPAVEARRARGHEVVARLDWSRAAETFRACWAAAAGRTPGAERQELLAEACA